MIGVNCPDCRGSHHGFPWCPFKRCSECGELTELACANCRLLLCEKSSCGESHLRKVGIQRASDDLYCALHKIIEQDRWEISYQKIIPSSSSLASAFVKLAETKYYKQPTPRRLFGIDVIRFVTAFGEYLVVADADIERLLTKTGLRELGSSCLTNEDRFRDELLAVQCCMENIQQLQACEIRA